MAVRLARPITRNIALYLPRNIWLDDITTLVSEENIHRQHQNGETSVTIEQVEVKEDRMGTTIKALNLLFGGFVTSQEGRYPMT